MPLELHEGQRDIFESKRSHNLALTGRRWGRTTLAVEMTVNRMTTIPGKRIHLFVASRHSIRDALEKIYGRLKELDVEIIYAKHNQITIANGSLVLINVFPWRDMELIFDDAFLPFQTTILEAFGDWHVMRRPSWDNPSMSKDNIQGYLPPEITDFLGLKEE